jgi:O-acetyl-ADP-ribose deacetylase (regulator of RNase III)
MASEKTNPTRWTHPSVIAIAPTTDPVVEVIDRAKAVALGAMEEGWAGPPFDPLSLADMLGVRAVAREDILDARTIPIGSDKLQIEFNPNRPKARLRFSIAHELAHTLFPDCREQVRHRLSRAEMRDDDWQLEMLCNLAAAEFLMPTGSVLELQERLPTIDDLLESRERYAVSMEAIMLRLHRLSRHPCGVFAASRREAEPNQGRYQIDYLLSAREWPVNLRAGHLLPADTAVAECTAIGYTAKSDETWDDSTGQIHVECVGVSPYPNHTFPRVLGIITSRKKKAGPRTKIEYLRGNALEPRGSGPRVIAQVVNDKTPRWGAGFARALAAKWPFVQKDFVDWSDEHKQDFRLGHTHLSVVDKSLSVFHMIAQKGYGTNKPGIRYSALENCLHQLAEHASQTKSSVHAPRIGCGEAGGRWEIVSELIDIALCSAGVPVVIYDLPQRSGRRSIATSQQSLFG